jgi:membrane protease subunit (stomatin/prohibitin family)
MNMSVSYFYSKKFLYNKFKYHPSWLYLMRLLGAMLVGGAAASIVGRHSARRQFEAMSAAQAQQEQINQAQAQAAQAAQIQAAQAQAPNQGKKDTIQELERLGRAQTTRPNNRRRVSEVQNATTLEHLRMT